MQLTRITTEYIIEEDRIRLTGEADESETVVIWLTQRLLTRLLPEIFQWLEGQEAASLRPEVLLEWRLRQAREALAPETPIRAPHPCMTVLTRSVDLTRGDETLLLRFRGAEDVCATQALAGTPPAPVDTILHDAWARSEWPATIWPEWVRDGAGQAAPQGVMH